MAKKRQSVAIKPRRSVRRGEGRGSRSPGIPVVPTNVRAAPLVSFAPRTFGFPDKLLTHLRYHDVVKLNSTLGSAVAYLFSMNSTFDPDVSGVGHQPLYRDTYASVYDQYVVTRAWGTLNFVNISNNAWIVGYNFEDDSTISSTLNTLCEQNHSQTTLLSPASGMNSVSMDFAWSYKDFLGVDPLASQSAKSPVASNPTEAAVLSIFGADQNAGSTGITIEVTLYQEVVWTELSTPSQS